ncbi:MAG TPA: glutamate-cysteine ligase family protein [Myxococcales bacterium]|nr:glutamate-cysteine ligase family protein [Myxococcales bacterium]
MSLDTARAAETPVTGMADLLSYFRTAERPRAEHRLGLEHEKLLFLSGSRPPAPVPYEGPRGVGALLGALGPSYAPFRERPDGPAIALQRGALTVSLEPGGQVELSGTPARTARELHEENVQHLDELGKAAARLGITVAALGYRPFGVTGEMPWMPKTRYRLMRTSLGERGRLALDMMLMTATGQVSLDWADEADCARKVCATARVAPLMVALYANSPLVRGAPSGLLSFRSRVWSDVDPARCGYLPSMIDGTFSYQSYVEWALDAPLLFLRRGGEYQPVQMTFREFMARGHEGKPATSADWVDHLSTLFPEVRIKKVMEVRGADCVSAPQTAALAALWRGLLYDPQALGEVERLLPPLSFFEHQEFHREAGKLGLKATLRGSPVSALAGELVQIARGGLQRLDPEDAPLLDVLLELVESGRSPAERVLEAWERDRDPAALVERFPP